MLVFLLNDRGAHRPEDQHQHQLPEDRGTLMRYAPPAGLTEAALAGGVVPAAEGRGLVPPPRRAHAFPPRRLGAAPAAVALPPVAPAAHPYRPPAPGAVQEAAALLVVAERPVPPPGARQEGRELRYSPATAATRFLAGGGLLLRTTRGLPRLFPGGGRALYQGPGRLAGPLTDPRPCGPSQDPPLGGTRSTQGAPLGEGTRGTREPRERVGNPRGGGEREERGGNQNGTRSRAPSQPR